MLPEYKVNRVKKNCGEKKERPQKKMKEYLIYVKKKLIADGKATRRGLSHVAK